MSAVTESSTADGTKTSTGKGRRRGIRGSSLAFWLFVGPFLVGLLVFGYVPIVWSLFLSFFDARNTVTPTDFVGLRNYADMLTDPNFLSSMVTFTVFAVFIVPLTFALSLGLALLVNGVRVARAFFRSVFFLPTACSYVVASLIWKLSIFNGVRFGLANTVLSWFGIENIAWLSTVNPPWYWIPLVTVRLWLQLGFYMILFIAGLQRIPTELYEAAYVDGAKPGWQVFRFITFPQLRATSIAVLLLNLIAAYQAFDEFYNLVGNVNYARPPLVYLYSVSLGSIQDLGRGSAGALILAVIIMILTLVQSRIFGFGKAD
ncbi:multiple sugar transport system permease protein [Actinopolymorpha cephalotaxi]|uniref:Multiple sugar transport system permease protein n=1 Tax=Actinopolymorpha cephalotaxi TaxID=504797 RepID=A0A1I2YDQ0_9ACTN|nr:sugar ABC transporter permease [Actinopolymorpha cephalotaxi]NYH87025.1 multiple sugar transport system permease protein [Actinopolymorpha cephalotaxi]SFH23685.1 multiple sugar transport system permease protein [Actinopolymorpha cephalotaxi]